ncbi:hypothetical protein DNFV4_03806 [Nitrospira tepida]|uniref:Uncharacterized protein n=1 Tax=Nitrospira tepida TaxID=2973512 RepID=A0AA86N2A4_9BACT|nr:hypothetical protein [Nitrospira tepida]CAI4033370.1 hypothetical protein DNFV4_03806 [Nitrospira tepida]
MAAKKALSVPRETRRGWIHADPGAVSIVQQCVVAGLARSTYYYEPVPERAENLTLMRLIDELYLQRPFYGVPRMTCQGSPKFPQLWSSKTPHPGYVVVAASSTRTKPALSFSLSRYE